MGSQKESKRILAKFSRGGVGNEGFVGCLPEEPEFTIPATYLLSCIVCSFVLSPCSCRLMQLVLSSLFLSCDSTSKSSNLCRVHTSLHPTYEDTNTFKYIQVISWHDYHHDLQHSARWCVRTFFFKILDGYLRTLSCLRCAVAISCPGLEVPIGLVDALELHEVKHCAKALGFLRCKRPWHFKENATNVKKMGGSF